MTVITPVVLPPGATIAVKTPATSSTSSDAPYGGVRIVDMPDLGAFTDASSVVGEKAGSGRFSAPAISGYLSGQFLPLSGGTVVNPSIGGGLGIGVGVTGYTASFQYGTETFHDHFAKVFNTAPGGRPNGQFNNLESVLTISASPASSNLTTAFTASVVTYSGGGALASTFYAVAMANNATMMAINTVCTDSSPATSGNFSGVRGQVEHDYFVRNSSTTVRGVMCNLSAVSPAGTPLPQLNQTSWIAFETSLFPNSSPWSVAYSSGNGTANTALLVGTTGPYGNPVETGDTSQTIQFLYTNNTVATSQRSISLYADPTFAGATGADLRISDMQFPGDKAHLALENLAYLKAMNAAGTATLGLIGLNGQDQMEVGGGVQTILIRGYNGGLASIAQFNAVAGAVNNVQFFGAVSGSAPTISSFRGQLGTDTNVGLNINTLGTGTLALQTGGSPTRVGGSLAFATLPTNAANDAAAASAGVAVGQIYRNGSALMIRVA